ncbi:MAG: DUF5615 family PIN-like protein [Verrucomicrobia bacterium]|nr:DUF5615 family PIN-like protein [Verrucomicrobiota bacterium]
MTIRLYLDEDSSDTNLLKALRLRGVDVLGAPDSGMLGRNDDEQLKWAASQQRALYSSNRADFYRIHSEFVRGGEDHFGIILGAQQRYTVGEQMRRLLHLTNRLTAEEMRNRVEFLNAWG